MRGALLRDHDPDRALGAVVYHSQLLVYRVGLALAVSTFPQTFLQCGQRSPHQSRYPQLLHLSTPFPQMFHINTPTASSTMVSVYRTCLRFHIPYYYYYHQYHRSGSRCSSPPGARIGTFSTPRLAHRARETPRRNFLRGASFWPPSGPRDKPGHSERPKGGDLGHG